MAGLHPLVGRVRFLNDASFLKERLMLPAEAPHAYTFAVPLRIVLWQHVGDLRPLGGSTIEKWPARAEAQTQDPELICPTVMYPQGHRLVASL